jgi:hypothetical protein
MISTAVLGCVYQMGVAYHVLDRSTQLFPCVRSRWHKPSEINCGGTAFGLDLEVSIDGNFLN